MTTVSGGVKGLVARAQREAQRRGHSPSTAYLLLVMLQSGGPMGNLLSRLGVKEGDLLSAIRVVDSEPISALERGQVGTRQPFGGGGKCRHGRHLSFGEAG